MKWHPEVVGISTLDDAHSPWAPEIDLIYVDGMRLFLDEFVFLHRPSRTLILADLAFNLDHDRSWFTKWSFRLIGAYPGCSILWFYRLAPRDRRHMRAKIERILDWDFDRLIVGHGDVVETDGKDALHNAYRRLLK